MGGWDANIARVDEMQVRAEIDSISEKPLEERAEALDKLIAVLERELESTSPQDPEQSPRP